MKYDRNDFLIAFVLGLQLHLRLAAVEISVQGRTGVEPALPKISNDNASLWVMPDNPVPR